MERNPGAWRKMAGLLIFLALCILPCSAETSNRQRIIALDNEIYQDIDALYMMNGFAPPSYARPWSEDEIDHILRKIQPEKLTGPAKLAYENIQKKLSKRLLFGKEKPDCIFCATDSIAAGAMLCCREAGIRIPDDVMIAAVGDSKIGKIAAVPITTAHLHYRTAGSEAAKMLLAAIKEPTLIPRMLQLDYYIIERESTGKTETV